MENSFIVQTIPTRRWKEKVVTGLLAEVREKKVQEREVQSQNKLC